MSSVKRYGIAGAAGISFVAMAALLPATASAGAADPFSGGTQPAANPRVGVQDNQLISGLDQTSVAWGNLPLVNPDTTNGITHYGYNTSNGGPLTQDPKEAFKTEPDKNVYLTFGNHHYLYQGHEAGPRGYVTRVDLDEADPAKKVTLIADQLVADTGSGTVAPPTFDGMTWDPFTQQLLLTAEAKSPKGGVFGVGLDGNGDATDGLLTRLPALGSGGYEGVQNDADGNVWLVEDVGGATLEGHNGKAPNSYVYRFTPTNKADLSQGGTLEALQVLRRNGEPVTADALTSSDDPFISQLHTYGTTFDTKWVTVPVPADAPGGVFDATGGAKKAGATPFKRPENGVFRPGTDFTEFYFTETGDTNANSDLPGAFGGVFRLSQSGPSAATGQLSLSVLGDVKHTGFDNIQFATRDQLLVVEDAGDSLHKQRNALDSGYVANLDENGQSQKLVRWLAEGRDPSATYDTFAGPEDYNSGDNEITGIHVSDGDPSVGGILGAKLPQPFRGEWRAFWTQQHGDNVTFELVPAGANGKASKGHAGSQADENEGHDSAPKNKGHN